MRQLKITKSITNRIDSSLDKYLTEIGRFDLINADQEVELASIIQNSTSTNQEKNNAKQKLINANLRFVVSVAKQYQNQGLPLSDLINEGNLGLIKSADRFDHTRGFKFISYAVWWIRQSIMQAINEQSRMVRLPLNQVALVGKYKKAVIKLESNLGRYPTNDEISIELEQTTAAIKKIQSYLVAKHVSFDVEVGDGNGTSLGSLFEAKDEFADPGLEHNSLKIEIKRIIQTFKERDRVIINHLFGLDGCELLSMEEVADILEITRERVRQIEDKILKKIRNTKKGDSLKQFLNK